MKSYFEEVVGKTYLKGVELAVRETDLPSRTFPSDSHYSLTEILDARFYPGETSELAGVKQKSSPNVAQTGLVRRKHVRIPVEPINK